MRLGGTWTEVYLRNGDTHVILRTTLQNGISSLSILR